MKRAVKIIYNSNLGNKEVEKEIVKEIEIMKSLDHPNIVKVYEYFLT